MMLSESQRNLGIIGAVSGIVQGLVWTILSIIAITMHYSPPTIENPKATFGLALSYSILTRFIKSSDDLIVPEKVIRPVDFVIFMYFYMIMSSIWCIISIIQLIDHTQYRRRERLIMTTNGTLTLMISIIDLIFMGLLARDYTDCWKEENKQILELEIFCYVSTGVVMTLSIRGFALWVFNLVFSYILIWISIKHVLKNNHWTTRNVRNIPRAKLRDDSSVKRGQSPIFSDEATLSFDRRKERSDSPIFSDSMVSPSFLDRQRKHKEAEPSPNDRSRNPPAFLNEAYEREHDPSKMRSFGDRGSKFTY